MKKSILITLYILLFVIVFLASALISIGLAGSAPQKLLKVDYQGEVITDLSYDNANGDYDKYIDAISPARLITKTPFPRFAATA